MVPFGLFQGFGLLFHVLFGVQGPAAYELSCVQRADRVSCCASMASFRNPTETLPGPKRDVNSWPQATISSTKGESLAYFWGPGANIKQVTLVFGTLKLRLVVRRTPQACKIVANTPKGAQKAMMPNKEPKKQWFQKRDQKAMIQKRAQKAMASNKKPKRQ